MLLLLALASLATAKTVNCTTFTGCEPCKTAVITLPVVGNVYPCAWSTGTSACLCCDDSMCDGAGSSACMDTSKLACTSPPMFCGANCPSENADIGLTIGLVIGSILLCCFGSCALAYYFCVYKRRKDHTQVH